MRQRTGRKNTDNGSWKEAGGTEQKHIIIVGKIKLVKNIYNILSNIYKNIIYDMLYKIDMYYIL